MVFAPRRPTEKRPMPESRAVTAGVEAITAKWQDDLDHPDPALRAAALGGWLADALAFVSDAALLAALGLDALVVHAFKQANASLSSGGDGGPWWALLKQYNSEVDEMRVVAEAEAFLAGGSDEGYAGER